jgi:adenylate cyclase
MQGDSIASTHLACADEYTKGLALYRERKWDEAMRSFEAALRAKPDDYPSQIYIERSELYRAAPPPRDWNGVFIMMTK